MRTQIIRHDILPNGLTLVVEPMPHVQSAAFSFLTPAGSIHEPTGKCGTAPALCDIITRGAGARDSRTLSNALDALGVQRDEGVGWNFLTFTGATLASNLAPALKIYGDILLRPALPADQMEAVLSGIEQSLLAIEDEPQRKVLIELRKRCYDDPWGRSSDGELEELERIDIAAVREHFHKHVRPDKTILGIAGNVDPDDMLRVVQEVFGEWSGTAASDITRTPHQPGNHHISHESTQTHISLAYPSVPYGHEDYYAAWAAVNILSGGSSSRLFTEVREKRGLVYSVYATHHSLLTEARVLAYAGTTAEKSQSTLDVMLAEIHRLADGIEPAELERCQARAKSSLIMQQESSASRAGSIARDWFHLQRVKKLNEVRREIDSLTVEKILDYVRRHPPQNMTVLTVGPEPLRVNG